MPISPERLVFAKELITDSRGRSLAADKSQPVFRPNKIPGRTTHLTDTQAFSEFQQNSEGVYAVINFLRLGYSTEALTVVELYELASAVKELPNYLVLRYDSPFDIDKIPPPIIDASRAAEGVTMTTGVIFSRGLPLDSKLDPNAIYDFAETTGVGGSPNLFVNPEGASCPAPEAVIKKVLDHMIHVKDKDAWSRVESPGVADYINPEEIGRILKFGILSSAFRYSIKNYDPEDPQDLGYIDPVYNDINSLLGYPDE